MEPGETFEHRDHARQLLALLDGVGARAGRFAANIDDIGAVLGKLGGVHDGAFRRVVETAVGE